jgi:hypothetical protein
VGESAPETEHADEALVGRVGVLERSWSLSVDTSKRLYQVAARRAPAQPDLIKERSARALKFARSFLEHPALSLHTAYSNTAQTVREACSQRAHASAHTLHVGVQQAQYRLATTTEQLKVNAAHTQSALNDRVCSASSALSNKLYRATSALSNQMCAVCGHSYARVCSVCQQAAAAAVQGAASMAQRVVRLPYVDATVQRTQNSYAIARHTLLSQSKQPNAWPFTRSLVTVLLRAERAVSDLSTSVLTFANTTTTTPTTSATAAPLPPATATPTEPTGVVETDVAAFAAVTDDAPVHLYQVMAETDAATDALAEDAYQLLHAAHDAADHPIEEVQDAQDVAEEGVQDAQEEVDSPADEQDSAPVSEQEQLQLEEAADEVIDEEMFDVIPSFA